MNQTTLPKNEINDLIDILISHKKLIAIVTLLITLIAIVYALVIQKPIYQATALIEIAKKNTFIAENSAALKERLTTIYKIYTHPNQPLPKISSVEKTKYSAGFLTLTALAYNKNELRELLIKSVRTIQEEHNLTVSAYIENQQNVVLNTQIAIVSSVKKIAQLSDENNRTTNRIKTLDNSQLAQIAISTLVVINNETKIIRVQEEEIRQRNYLNAIDLTLDSKRTFNTKLINGIDIHPKPITPRRSMIIVVGFVSGLLLSILLSFFLAFIASIRD